MKYNPSWPAAIILSICSGAAAQPANNACSNATPIGNTTIAGTTTAATTDGSSGCAGTSPDVWYRYTATATTTVTVTTCNLGTSYDTVISVHTPTCPGTSTTQIVCNDQTACTYSPNYSTLTFTAINGTQYLVRVSGWAGS